MWRDKGNLRDTSGGLGKSLGVYGRLEGSLRSTYVGRLGEA